MTFRGEGNVARQLHSSTRRGKIQRAFTPSKWFVLEVGARELLPGMQEGTSTTGQRAPRIWRSKADPQFHRPIPQHDK